MYLLDTNIISDLAKNPGGPVGKKIGRIDPSLIATSTIVACEIGFGLANRPERKSAAKSVEFLETMTILPLGADVADAYASTRAMMAQRGLGIAAHDLLIAVHAITMSATVVSDDRVFSTVPGLKVENWLRA